MEEKKGSSFFTSVAFYKGLLIFATVNLIIFAVLIALKPERNILEYTEKMYSIGDLLQSQGKIEPALKYYRKIVEDYPYSVYADEALFNIAVIQLRIQFDFNGAVDNFRKVIRDYPHSDLMEKSKKNISFIESRRDYNDEPLKLFYQAGAFKRSKDYQNAVNTLKIITKEYADSKVDIDALYWIGKLNDKYLNSPEKAKISYVQLCKKHPKSSRAKEVYPNLKKNGITIAEMEPSETK